MNQVHKQGDKRTARATRMTFLFFESASALLHCNRRSRAQHLIANRLNQRCRFNFAFMLACALSIMLFTMPADAQRMRSAQRPTINRTVTEDVLLRILQAEDERRWNDDLATLLRSRSVAVRQRAALAAGRISAEAAVEPLAKLLHVDADESVRAMAAFALGEIEAASSAESLLRSLRGDKSAAVRAKAVEALGKTAAALPKADERMSSVIGTAITETLNAQAANPKSNKEIVLAGLTAALRARPADAGASVQRFLTHEDATVRATAANTLARLAAKNANEALRSLLNDDDAIVRANAARALGAAKDAAAHESLVIRAVGDPDERVRVSAARALANLKNGRAASSLLERHATLLDEVRKEQANGVARPTETSELLEVSAALGEIEAGTGSMETISALRAARETLWSAGSVAPELEIAFARVAPSQYLRDELTARFAAPITQAPVMQTSAVQAPVQQVAAATTPAMNGVSGTNAANLKHTNTVAWQPLAALAQGLGEVGRATSSDTAGNSQIGVRADALIRLRLLTDSANTPALALPDALRALAAFKPEDLNETLRTHLNASDPYVRAAAAELLGETTLNNETISALADKLVRSLSSLDEPNSAPNDDALAMLAALGKAEKSTLATENLKRALDSSDYLVRYRAVQLLKARGAGDYKSRVGTVESHFGLEDYRRAIVRRGKRVTANVLTDKGAFTIELLPNDAPLTVENFVQLARSGFFDRLPFHRIVPNFVVQTGDPRGDGNGGPPYQIRCEINSVPYTRGTVGMALSGKDTGGSQWFVTHSPQPHLDGGYTVFGKVVDGMETIDALVRGDLIRRVTIAESERPRAVKRGRR